MVLPIQDPHDDSSTDTPEDEDTLFDREEALRHDDAIMDFQWFRTISWDEIKDLRGTTYVQPPTRLKFALQQAQHAILRAILYNEPSSPMSEPAWKVLLLSSWLLLGRPAEKASDANCASFLETRLDLFWSEDWPALWAMVRAECDVPAIAHTHSRTKAEQTETRVRKVATLARSGEKGRALAAARNAPPVPVTKEIVQEIRSLYPVDPDPAVPSSARLSVTFTAEVMDFIPITLKRMPRLSEPGPLGMRAEHWYDFGTQAGDSDLFARIIAHIATATIPDAVLQYLRAGQVTPLAKPTGGHRPLLMMSFLRRLALKAVIAAKKASITDAVGPLQHGVGCKDGANKMIKSIQYFAEADQSRVLVALDLKAAFQNVSRRQMLHSLSQYDSDLATVFSRWYTGSTTHRMHYDGSYAHIQASSGIDQGCPLSPCGFAAAVDPISRYILTQTHQTLDTGARLWAYLDDWYIWIKLQHIPDAIELVATATLTINLELQPSKIQIWTASCTSPIPPAYLDKAKPTLKCLGAHLRIAGDSEGSPVELGGRPSMNTATMRFRSISDILLDLNQAGLKLQTVNDLLTMYVGAASQHALRTTFVPYEEAVSFGKEIVAYWSQLAGRDVTSPLFHLPLRMGGLGVGSAVQRHAAATLMAATDLTDTDALFAATPILRRQLLHLQPTLAQPMDTPALLLKSLGAALRTHGTQKKLVGAIQHHAHKQIMDSYVNNQIQRAILLSQSTKNTGAHFQQPSTEAHEADDRCFQVSLARRLMLAHPAAAHATDITPTCPNVSAAKRACTCLIDSHQIHCMICKKGGGVDQRHSALARCLADLITTHTGVKVHLEQTIPEIPRQPRRGAQPEGARMEIVFNLHGQIYYIDTAVVTPFSANTGLMSAASARPGNMAKREEKKNSTDTPASTWSLSSWRPLDDLVFTPRNSLNTSTTTRTTPLLPSETPGPPSKPHSMAASPNNNSGQSPRDHTALCLTSVTPPSRLPFLSLSHTRLSTGP